MHTLQLASAARRATLGGLIAAAALGSFAGAAQARGLRGTVVHRNPRAHSFVIADARGGLFAVHARRSPRPGTVVAVSARSLRNGTFSAQSIRALGHRSRVRVHGTVSYVNRRRGFFALSADGVSMLVHARRARGVYALPPVGTDVTVSGTVSGQDELDEQSAQDDGNSSGVVALEGTILAVDTTAGTITLSADDADQSGASLTVTVPGTLDISKFAVGDEVELQVVPQADGSYLLQGSASDDSAQSADDQSDEQGDVGDDEGEAASGGDQGAKHQGDQGNQGANQGDQVEGQDD